MVSLKLVSEKNIFFKKCGNLLFSLVVLLSHLVQRLVHPVLLDLVHGADGDGGEWHVVDLFFEGNR